MHRYPCHLPYMTRLSLDLAPIVYSGLATYLGDPTSITLALSPCPSHGHIELALT